MLSSLRPGDEREHLFLYLHLNLDIDHGLEIMEVQTFCQFGSINMSINIKSYSYTI